MIWRDPSSRKHGLLKGTRTFRHIGPPAVVICLYKVGPELSRTIESLVACATPLDIVVVADGLAKLSESMKDYLSKTFQLRKTTAASLLNGDPTHGDHRTRFYLRANH